LTSLPAESFCVKADSSSHGVGTNVAMQ